MLTLSDVGLIHQLHVDDVGPAMKTSGGQCLPRPLHCYNTPFISHELFVIDPFGRYRSTRRVSVSFTMVCRSPYSLALTTQITHAKWKDWFLSDELKVTRL